MDSSSGANGFMPPFLPSFDILSLAWAEWGFRGGLVLAKSNICPSDPTFVLSLSSSATKIDVKSTRQNLVNFWTWLFSPLPSCHPASGQNLDNLWTWVNPKFIHLLSMSDFPSETHVYPSIYYLDKFCTNIRHMANFSHLSRSGHRFDLSYKKKFHLSMNIWWKCFQKM